MATNKELMAKLEKIDKKITYRAQISRLDNIFAVSAGMAVAGIPMAFIEGLKDTYIPISFVIVGLALMFGTNFWRERIKKQF